MRAVKAGDRSKPAWRMMLERFAGPMIVLIALAPFLPAIVAWVGPANVVLTPPDLSILAKVPLAVQVHLAAVMVCLPLGAYVLFTTKGTSQHKQLGRVWVAAMLTTCISALFIKSFSPLIGPFGLIHLLVLWSMFSLGRGMYAIIVKRDLQRHLRNMQGAYWGLIIAGLFSFIPGRMMWSMFTAM
ncbi:MAG: DUF2306 domain-containing protein [Hyphomonadaceae bacterium]|nr:DUF2306 domain-containing protein [Hyphomonadaceae bacterium]